MRKYTVEEKVKIVQGYINGEYSWDGIAHELGYKRPPGCFRRWYKAYQTEGITGLLPKSGNSSYTKEFKELVVKQYLDGLGTSYELSNMYKIHNETVLLQWVKLYNANRELKDYCPKPEVYMAEARRKTTIEERKKIVEYCINHNRNYKETASIYEVSYNQVYSWVKKYDKNGAEALIDKRGHHKTDDELDELERLRRENQRLKRKLEEQDMLVELLKKVKEFEGM